MVTVYSKSQCKQCDLTKVKLDQLGVDYQIKSIEDPDALAEVKGLGYLSVPVVQTETTHWNGFRPDLLSSLAA